MSLVEICITGLKVIAGVGTGLVIFFGLFNKPKRKVRKTNCYDNNNNNVTDNVKGNQASSQQPSMPNSNNIINNLQKIQSICEKTYTIVRTLTVTFENLSQIFNNTENNYNNLYYNNNLEYRNNPWSYNQPINMSNGQVWNRVSPFIVEVPDYRNRGGYDNSNSYYTGNGNYPI